MRFWAAVCDDIEHVISENTRLLSVLQDGFAIPGSGSAESRAGRVLRLNRENLGECPAKPVNGQTVFNTVAANGSRQHQSALICEKKVRFVMVPGNTQKLFISLGVFCFASSFVLGPGYGPVDSPPGAQDFLGSLSFSAASLGPVGEMDLIASFSNIGSLIPVLLWFCLFGLAVSLVFGLARCVIFWRAPGWPPGALVLPQFQGHRGYRPSPEVRENTLHAFRLAKAAGAEMTECDVHLSKDGEPVIFHDFDLMRITGSAEKTNELTAAELALKVGAPTLRELLQDGESPQKVNIELKTARIFSPDNFERAVVRVVESTGAQKRVLFSSFNPFCLYRLSRLAPDIPRALLVTEERHPRNRIWFRRMWFGALARPHLLHLDQNMITARRLLSFKERGLRVAVWTVNDRKRADELLRMGATSIISDVLLE